MLLLQALTHECLQFNITSADGIYDVSEKITFESSRNFSRYLKESYWLNFDKHYPFKCFFHNLFFIWNLFLVNHDEVFQVSMA